jgi:abhydrolase domain-containing protein 12
MFSVKIPNTDYSDVKKHGRFSGRNFYLEANGDDAKLGVWHIFPKSVEKQLDANLTEDHVQRLIRGGKNGIIVYLHGNTSDRTEFHRCGTYQLLSEMNFHVLAVDYRGYGDSTGRPTEDGVVSDAKTIYNYARNYLDPTTSVYVWGHSMGTGVAARAVAELCDAGIQPKALVLGENLIE